jgi:hypothetical protein
VRLGVALTVVPTKGETPLANPRQTHTNAADSAPGVNDGPVTGRGPPVDSKPGGRKILLVVLALAVIAFLVVFLAKPVGQNSTVNPDGSTAPTDISETSGAPSPSY